jgi:deoxyribonuclease (pyrimidine dimer)
MVLEYGMTRINANIAPTKLLDQHLMAEYRESPMVYAALRRSIKSGKPLNIPKKFTLNTGHVSFFYDKLAFLQDRYDRLVLELKTRGFNLDSERVYDLSEFPDKLFGDYSMTDEDFSIIRERIVFRFDEKPTWYRYYGDPIDRETYLLIMDQPAN